MSQGRSRGRNSRSPRRSHGSRSGGKRSPRRDRDRSPTYGRGGGGGGYDNYGSKGGYGGGGGGYGGAGPPPQAVYITGDGPGADRGSDCCCLVIQVIFLVIYVLSLISIALSNLVLFAASVDSGLWAVPVFMAMSFIFGSVSCYFLGKAVNAGFKGRALPGGNPERPRQFAEWYHNTLTWWKIEMLSCCCTLLVYFSGVAFAIVALQCAAAANPAEAGEAGAVDLDFAMKNVIHPASVLKLLYLGQTEYIDSVNSLAETARQASSDSCASAFLTVFGVFIAYTIGLVMYYGAILYLFPYNIKQSWMKEDPERRFARGAGAPPGYGGAPRY